MKTWLYLDDERTPSYNFSKDIDINDGENLKSIPFAAESSL
jgi:hypothetical protein